MAVRYQFLATFESGQSHQFADGACVDFNALGPVCGGAQSTPEIDRSHKSI